MKVIVAKTAGFCWGVRRAMDAVLEASTKQGNGPVQTLGPLIHNPQALELIGSSDCTTCHRLSKASSGASIGPAYDEVAAKYAPAADTTINRLVNKIISGGSGVWGTVPMTPHAALSKDDATTIVKYIMTLKK